VTRKRRISADRVSRGASGFAARAVKDAQPGHALAAALFPPRVVLFVALFAWYLCAVVNLRLVFQTRDVLFLWNVRYFTDFLGQPGALLEWAHNLLMQLCYWGWPAAIVVAAAAWLLFVSTIGLMNALGRARIGGTWVIPGVLLVVLYSRYVFPTPAVVGLALAMTAANVWCRMPARRTWPRLVLFVAISVVLYYVLGEAYYCFAACCAVHEALAERRRLSGVLFLLATAAVKFALDAVLARFDLASHTFHVLFRDKQPNSAPDWWLTALYLYFPACALFVVFRQTAFSLIAAPWRRRAAHGKARPPERGRSKPEDLKDAGKRDRSVARAAAVRWLRWTGGSVLVLSLAAIAGYYSLNRAYKTLREIDYCADHQLWDDVLARVRMVPLAAYSRSVNHDVNRALYYTGRLPYQMLLYPQLYDPVFSVDDVSGNSVLFSKPYDCLLELGRVNDAEHVAMEMLEMRPSGKAIKYLALAKMIKGQPANARVLLNVLRDDLVWGRWAEQYLQHLAADPELAGDEEVQRLRRAMISKDDTHRTMQFHPDGKAVYQDDAALLSLLKQNGANRMAFEYLMAMYLHRGDVRGVAEAFPFLDDLPYPTTPPLYEEAVLIYLSDHPEKTTEVGSDVLFRGRRISGPTLQKFRRLQAIASLNGGLNEKAEAAVARELGNTYFYYFFYTSRKRS
jgi:hypothetical protein